MKNILVLSDYIEDYPIIASVRYADLMKHISKKYNIICINNIKYGEFKSKYSIQNIKFKTLEKAKKIQNKDEVSKEASINKFKHFIKNTKIINLYRYLCLSNFIFDCVNFRLYKKIYRCIKENNIELILVTVPKLYPLYILKRISKKFKDIPVVIEIRDIINNDLEKDYPRFLLKNGENIALNNADSIIALSEGIEEYYSDKTDKSVHLIRNGYDEEKFDDCFYNENLKDKDTLVFSHIGSIYRGRNIKDFILGLNKFAVGNNKLCKLNIAGDLDTEAIKDIEECKSLIDDKLVQINKLGIIPHKEAIRCLKESDISVIVTHKSGSDYAIPGKTFECIGACVPIIAVSQDSALMELIDGKYGECAKHDADDISKKILKLIESNYDFSSRNRFSRKLQAESIINVIEETIGLKDRY